MVGIFEPACELLRPWTKELYLAIRPLRYQSIGVTPPPPITLLAKPLRYLKGDPPYIWLSP